MLHILLHTDDAKQGGEKWRGKTDTLRHRFSFRLKMADPMVYFYFERPQWLVSSGWNSSTPVRIARATYYWWTVKNNNGWLRHACKHATLMCETIQINKHIRVCGVRFCVMAYYIRWLLVQWINCSSVFTTTINNRSGSNPPKNRSNKTCGCCRCYSVSGICETVQ